MTFGLARLGYLLPGYLDWHYFRRYLYPRPMGLYNDRGAFSQPASLQNLLGNLEPSGPCRFLDPFHPFLLDASNNRIPAYLRLYPSLSLKASLALR